MYESNDRKQVTERITVSFTWKSVDEIIKELQALKLKYPSKELHIGDQVCDGGCNPYAGPDECGCKCFELEVR